MQWFIGGWNKSAKDSYEGAKPWALLAMAPSGSQLSVLAESLGMKVIYHDAMTKLPLGNATQVGSLEECCQKRMLLPRMYPIQAVHAIS